MTNVSNQSCEERERGKGTSTYHDHDVIDGACPHVHVLAHDRLGLETLEERAI